MSNTDDERVSKFQLQRPSQKNFITLFRDYFHHAYNLYTSLRQPSTRTGEFTMATAGQPSGPTQAAPEIKSLLCNWNFPKVVIQQYAG